MKPGDRAAEPLEDIEVGEDATTCGHCGARTELIESNPSGSWRRENCLFCGQRYNVTDADDAELADALAIANGGDFGDIEVVDENTGRVVGMTGSQLDEVLLDLTGEVFPENDQDALNHLFGIKTPDRPDHPDFGSF